MHLHPLPTFYDFAQGGPLVALLLLLALVSTAWMVWLAVRGRRSDYYFDLLFVLALVPFLCGWAVTYLNLLGMRTLALGTMSEFDPVLFIERTIYTFQCGVLWSGLLLLLHAFVFLWRRHREKRRSA